MGRGNRHGVIYRDKDDYGLFLRLLKEVQNRYPFVLHAYCLMTNHFHLELTTANDPIWKIMQPVMNHYARMFNQKYGYTGLLLYKLVGSKMTYEFNTDKVITTHFDES